MTPFASRWRRTARRAFTAIEVTAVATILAILALIIIPLLRGRVEAARLTAAQDDLTQLMKGEMLCEADTGRYFRLQDLDNTTFYNPANPNDQLDLAVPHTYWNITMSAIDTQRGQPLGTERLWLKDRWKGPYITAPRTTSQATLLGEMEYLFWWNAGTGGPILVTDRDDLPKEQIPVDPWGNPYLFFGTGKIYDSQSPPPGVSVRPKIAGSETDFANAALYCFGPDGRPSDARTFPNPTQPDNYFRERGYLGATGTDDLRLYF
ncbi:MAG: hypothetical protein NTW86_23360 [Candidatus Sumerlaeota bacterium]|nr:hypothetical protein [Candidatus Sumerlaeota bacterium]